MFEGARRLGKDPVSVVLVFSHCERRRISWYKALVRLSSLKISVGFLDSWAEQSDHRRHA